MKFGLLALTVAGAMGVFTASAQADHGQVPRYSRGHQSYHGELDHRDFHRNLYHQDAHQYPMTRGQHGQLHGELNHDAYHDGLEHRQNHRNAYSSPYRSGYGQQPRFSIRFGW